MGRHRNDPLGHSRYVIGVGAVVLLLALVGLGVYAFHGAWSTSSDEPTLRAGSQSQPARTTKPAGGNGPSTSASSASGAAPTLQLLVTGTRAHIVVRAPGGDVLMDQNLKHGEHATFSQPALDVVLSDGGAVRVKVHGKLRSPAKSGQHEQFSITPQG